MQKMKKYIFLYDENICGEIPPDYFDSLHEASELYWYIADAGKMQRAQRLRTAHLLQKATAILLDCGVCAETLKLKKQYGGKPYFEASVLKISISHTDGISAVAFAVDAEIGVDIEAQISDDRCARLNEKYLSAISFYNDRKDETCNTCDERRDEKNTICEDLKNEKNAVSAEIRDERNIISYKLADEKETGCKVLKYSTSSEDNIDVFVLKDDDLVPICLSSSDGSVTEKWTQLEAVLKCDGSGFSALSMANSLAQKMKIYSFVYISNEKKYYISLAEHRK